MRIRKLDLSAYGPFTNTQLDLSEGNFGLHIVYGRNEAGKSSSLRAITDLLFGIPARTKDNFVHRFTKLRIRGELETADGSVFEFVRRKGNKKTLYDGQDKSPLEGDPIAPLLGTVDRELFKTMFGIDHQRLRDGGAELASGNGRIGELLFSAGAGIANLQAAQNQLNQDIEELLKSSGRSGKIIDDINEYKRLREEVKLAQVTSDTWKQHDDRLQAAEKRKEILDNEIREHETERLRLTRIYDAIPAIGRWRKAKLDLLPVAEAPLLPVDFDQQTQAYQIELSNAKRQVDESAETLKAVNDQRAKLSLPQTILEHGEAIEAMQLLLGAHRQSIAEKPRLAARLEEAENEARESLHQLGRVPDLERIDDLRLPADRKIRIQSLGNQNEALLERLRTSQLALERVQQTLDRFKTLTQEKQQIPDLKELNRVIDQIRSQGDLTGQLQSLGNEVEVLEERVQVQIQQLPLWNGTVEQLQQMVVPTMSTMERFADEFKSNEMAAQAAQTRLVEKTNEQDRLKNELERLESDRIVPTEKDLIRARQTRERGWQLVKAAWETSTEPGPEDFLNLFPDAVSLADAFQISVAAADRIVDQIREDASLVAQKTRLEFDLIQTEQMIENRRTELSKIQQQRKELEIRWVAIWQELPITPLSPVEMRDWAHQFQVIREAIETLLTKRTQAGQIRQLIENQTCQLASIMRRVRPDAPVEDSPLPALLQQAELWVEEVRELQSRHVRREEQLETARLELIECETSFRQAQQSHSEWLANWSCEMKALGLQEDALPAQANNQLSEIDNLFQRVREAEQARTQLEQIDRSDHDFEKQVRELVSRTIPDLASQSPEQSVTILMAKLHEARQIQQQREALDQRIDELTKKQRQAQETSAQYQSSLEQMCQMAGCRTPDELPKISIASQRRRSLESTIQGLEETISGLGGGADFETFLQDIESETADLDTLPPRIAELKSKVEQWNAERDLVIGQIREEKLHLDAIDGGSKASQRNLECQSISARLEDRVVKLANLRMAAAVLRTAIETYRDNNQGPVLARSNELFQRMTVGQYAGIQADYDENGEPVLTGVKASNQEQVLVEAMSDGTCDQLYLALRLASLENWLTHHEPIPLVVDDVLLNFDDQRAAASLQALAEFSQLTQVIFFTHHQHLVDLAREHVPSHQLFLPSLEQG